MSASLLHDGAQSAGQAEGSAQYHPLSSFVVHATPIWAPLPIAFLPGASFTRQAVWIGLVVMVSLLELFLKGIARL